MSSLCTSSGIGVSVDAFGSVSERTSNPPTASPTRTGTTTFSAALPSLSSPPACSRLENKSTGEKWLPEGAKEAKKRYSCYNNYSSGVTEECDAHR